MVGGPLEGMRDPDRGGDERQEEERDGDPVDARGGAGHAALGDRVWARLHVLVYNLGVVLLEPAIDRHLPEPLRSPEGLERWREAATAMFHHGLYVTDPTAGPSR